MIAGVLGAAYHWDLRRILAEHPGITLAQYKAVLRRQWAMLTIDSKAALESLPSLLPAVLLVLVFQKYMVQGLTAGSVKG